MKVKITKGKHWYKDKVGEIFEVTGILNDDGKYSTTQESTDELLKTEVDQGVVGYFINSKHCEEVKEMSKFNIGSMVLIMHHIEELNGRIAEIIEYREGKMFPWRVKFDDDQTEVVNEGYMKLVEDQWMNKATALKLCIDGAKVMSAEDGASTEHYIDFNGTLY